MAGLTDKEESALVAAFSAAGLDCRVEHSASGTTFVPFPKADSVFAALYRVLLREDARPYVSEKERAAVLLRTHGKCFYCGANLAECWHVDHFVPRSRGGADSLENYVAACSKCNASKGSRLPTRDEARRFAEVGGMTLS